MSPDVVLEIGAVFAADYRIVKRLASGGMGAVYVAEQLSTGKNRALKVMHPDLLADDAMRRRFVQEARVGARIKSEHVVEVHAAGIDAAKNIPYLVMELLEGEDLGDRVASRGPMSIDEVRGVFEQLCHGVAAAHDAGVVHRDLKPKNVFLAREQRAGGGILVKVLDFGIATIAGASTRTHTAALGSPYWMAPEQTTPAKLTPAADVWALGLIAFTALTGIYFWRTAHGDRSISTLLREVIFEPIPAASLRAAELDRPRCLPPGFDAWFARCLDREPLRRPPDARAAWHALRDVLEGRASEEAPSTLRDGPSLLGPSDATTSGFVAAPPPGAPTGSLADRLPTATPPVAGTAPAPPEHVPSPVATPPARILPAFVAGSLVTAAVVVASLFAITRLRSASTPVTAPTPSEAPAPSSVPVIVAEVDAGADAGETLVSDPWATAPPTPPSAAKPKAPAPRSTTAPVKPPASAAPDPSSADRVAEYYEKLPPNAFDYYGAYMAAEGSGYKTCARADDRPSRSVAILDFKGDGSVASVSVVDGPLPSDSAVHDCVVAKLKTVKVRPFSTDAKAPLRPWTHALKLNQ